jgi:DNA-directed RNA polymerase subunit RPC12/RpoP
MPYHTETVQATIAVCDLCGFRVAIQNRGPFAQDYSIATLINEGWRLLIGDRIQCTACGDLQRKK